MANPTSTMCLYSLTLRPPTAITQAIVGSFSGTRDQQILTASGSHLALLHHDAALGKIAPLVSQNLFCIIRSMAAFRLAGSSKDYILLASDSGRIAVIEYLPAQNRFARVHLETFGRSGVRRVVPGQYLVVNPKGRACLIASIEKTKFVYVLNRNAQAELTISSPLEAHKHGVLVFSVVALDVGYANPVFASLETDYSHLDQNPSSQSPSDVELVYYELDLGLNHMVRKWSEPVDPTSSLLFQVLGGSDGPSGVLVCADDRVAYHHSNQDSLSVPIPRRRAVAEDPQRKRMIVSGVMHKLKNSAQACFFLLQTEDGDLFKVTLGMQEDAEGRLTGEVNDIKLKYFDTVPVAKSLCILKTGFLFVASEFGDHHLYRVESLGDGGHDVEFSSHDGLAPVFFDPRPLTNLALVETIDSMNPLLASEVATLTGGQDAPQIYSVCGNGARSRFVMLSHGLGVNEIVASELPGTVSAVWTTKLTRHDVHDTYIILTSSTDTLVLSIGEEVSQVADSGFLTSVHTLAVQQIGDNGLAQVHPKGIRHIRHDGQIIEWPAPQHRSIVAAATNQRQIAVALSSGEIVYFEVDDSDGSLAEYDTRAQMSGTVTCLGLGEVPEGRLRSSFLAVGCDDCTVRVLNLEPESTLESMSVQAVSAAPSALCIMPMEDSSAGGSWSTYLHIGLDSGVCLRTLLDEITGSLTDTEHRFLGIKAVKLFRVSVQQKSCVLALSSKPWTGYVDPARGFMLTPRHCESLDWAWSFSSEQCQEGVIGVHGNNLRIFSVESLHDNVIQKSIPLKYTPRHLVKHPDQPYFYTIESDNNTLDPELCAQLAAARQQDANGDQEGDSILPPEQFGHPRGQGRWASCISVVDPAGEQVLQRIHLTDIEAATSLAIVPFASQNNEPFLIVGTSQNLILNPRSSDAGYLHVYRFHSHGRALTLLHKTRVPSPPTALAAFNGRLAAGLGSSLFIFDLGLKQLLRKTQAPAAVPTLVVSIQPLAEAHLLAVADARHGVSVMAYHPAANTLAPLADDAIPRWTTCLAALDSATVAGGDKFGNLWIVRCRPDTANKPPQPCEGGRPYLGGAPDRLAPVAHFYAQDIPTHVTKTQLVPGGPDVILWSGLQGTIGVLGPLASREEAELFCRLEWAMREVEGEGGTMVGREHGAFRGYYVPVKGVVDGDLCERFWGLSPEGKGAVAGAVGRGVGEVERAVKNMRARYAF